MFHKYICISLLVLFSLCPTGLFAQTTFGVCDIFGKIAITNIKKEADAIVFQGDSEFSVNLKVYQEKNILMADLPGLWFIVDPKEGNGREIDYHIYITQNQDEADFSIYYVDNSLYAGCDENE